MDSLCVSNMQVLAVDMHVSVVYIIFACISCGYACISSVYMSAVYMHVSSLCGYVCIRHVSCVYNMHVSPTRHQVTIKIVELPCSAKDCHVVSLRLIEGFKSTFCFQ